MWLKLLDAKTKELKIALPLSEGTTVIGRGRGSQIIISDSKLSSAHIELRLDGEALYFRDLDSTSGCFLNGQRKGESAFNADDDLLIGGTLLQVTRERPKIGLSARQSADKKEVLPEQTSLKALLDGLNQSARPTKLLSQLLHHLVTMLSAQRGFILLREKARGGLVPVTSHSIEDLDEFISLSSTVYENALSKNKTIVIDDTAQLPPGREALSMALYETPRTIVCTPLAVDDEAFGVLYLDMKKRAEGIPSSSLEAIETGAALAASRLALYKTRWRLIAARDKALALNSLAWEDSQMILGDGAASKQLRQAIAAAASQDTTVLILGDTGTGKEVVARALHHASSRRQEAFVAVNCAALPRELLEAELFGAEKGAYTGATERRLGRFELASGGTLFLDEIGELPQDIQIRLLRVLQERKLQRLGGTEDIELDFRLVCATNRNLEEAVRAGTFRSDFYYRINVFSIELKPLAERKEDIRLLAEHFLHLFGKQFGRSFLGFSEDSERLLLSYPWPGNIRELRNAVERAAVIERSSHITKESLPIGSVTVGSIPNPTCEGQSATLTDAPLCFDEARNQFERAFLKRSLLANGGNVAAVVRETGIGRPTIYRWLKRFGLKPDGSDE